MTRLIMYILRTTALMVLVLPSALLGQAEGGKEDHEIVYLSNRGVSGRSFNIFLNDLSNGLEQNVTAGKNGLGITSLSGPRLLRRRRSIVCFASGGKSLVEIPIGGGEIRTLAQVTQVTGPVSVAPDEGAVLFVDRKDGRTQIFEADIAGGAIRNLSSNRWNDTEASYSPDGTKIVHVSDRDGSLSVVIMERDGSGQRLLTNDFGDDRFPRFSPSGDRIVFASSRGATEEEQYDLYSIDTCGGDFRLLFTNGAFNTAPVVSRDDTVVAFVSSNLAKKVSRIFLLNLTNGTARPLAEELPFLSLGPAFSPDGRILVFEHNTIRDCEIMMYHRERGFLRNLSQNGSWDCAPSF
jgi:Tol biopolymer transport system component